MKRSGKSSSSIWLRTASWACLACSSSRICSRSILSFVASSSSSYFSSVLSSFCCRCFCRRRPAPAAFVILAAILLNLSRALLFSILGRFFVEPGASRELAPKEYENSRPQSTEVRFWHCSICSDRTGTSAGSILSPSFRSGRGN